MGQILSKLILRLLGWKIKGWNFNGLDKYVIIEIPHTSNWDFPLGILLRGAQAAPHVKFVGKKSLFNPPLGWIMYPMGGIPVDRSGRHSFVDSVVKVFNKTDRLAIALAPEGTRKKVETFKTGYYYIAVGAGVPIIPTVFNWEKREVIFMDPIHLTGDADEELAMVENIFRNYKGRNKENSFT